MNNQKQQTPEAMMTSAFNQALNSINKGQHPLPIIQVLIENLEAIQVIVEDGMQDGADIMQEQEQAE